MKQCLLYFLFVLNPYLYLTECFCVRNNKNFMNRVNEAAFGPGDLGSNPHWFAVSNLNQKLYFHK